MESYKSYTAAEIENLKKKVVAYKNLLTTLKVGASLEDYLFIKGEFEELKGKMADISLLKDEGTKEHTNDVEEHEVKQVSNQLNSLNEMVEEVLTALNKITVEERKKGEVMDNKTTSEFKNVNRTITEPKMNGKRVITQPSYNQLRNLAGQVIYRNNNEEEIKHEENDEKTSLHVELQHPVFNKQYFQTINNRQQNAKTNSHMKPPNNLQGSGELLKRMNGTAQKRGASTQVPNLPSYRGLRMPQQPKINSTSQQIAKVQQTNTPITPLTSSAEEIQVNNLPSITKSDQTEVTTQTSIELTNEVERVEVPIEETKEYNEQQLDIQEKRENIEAQSVNSSKEVTGVATNNETEEINSAEQQTTSQEQNEVVAQKSESQMIPLKNEELEQLPPNEAEELNPVEQQKTLHKMDEPKELAPQKSESQLIPSKSEELEQLLPTEEKSPVEQHAISHKQDERNEAALQKSESQLISPKNDYVEQLPPNEAEGENLVEQQEQLPISEVQSKQEENISPNNVTELVTSDDPDTLNSVGQQNEQVSESDESEKKKQWSSSFFNFFRKNTN